MTNPDFSQYSTLTDTTTATDNNNNNVYIKNKKSTQMQDK